MTQVYDRYYKVKVTFQDIAPCPHFSKYYKSYRVSFLGESRNAPSPVRAKFRCRAIAHFVQYKNQ